MGKLTKEFRDFAFKGNVVDMAVGVVVGGAFGKIVTSLVNDVIMPPIGVLLGGVDFSDLVLVLKPEVLDGAGQVAAAAVTLNYGNFIKTIVDFLLVALSVFIFVKLISTARKKLEKKKEEPVPAPPPAPGKEEILLTEIRDLLAEQKKKS